MRILFVLPLTMALAGVSATPAELRTFCADRPGLATPACIVDKGHLQIETGIMDWSRGRRDGVASDSIGFAGTEARYGLTGRTEIGVSWSAFNLATLRDRNTGVRSRFSGIGDLKIAVRQSLASPDGSGLALAIEPFVTAPTGASGIGAGNWATGLLLPFSIDIGGGYMLGTTAEIDWSPNAAGTGHHTTYSGVVAVSHAVGPVQAGVEFAARRDADPDATLTRATADLSLAWVPQLRPGTQFDAGLNIGLNRNTPGMEIYLGAARRF